MYLDFFIFVPMEKDIGTHIVYSDGRIFKKNANKFIGSTLQNGYIIICLNGKQRSLHRLLAECFLLKEPHHEVVNHKNGVKTDNRLENLEWCTVKENVQHAFKNGLMVRKKGSGNHQSKLTEDKVFEIKRLIAAGRTMTSIAIEYGVTLSCIWLIKKGRNWGHIVVQ